MTAQAEFTGKTVGVQADVAVWARSGLVRLDLQKLSLSSQNPSQSALLTQLLPSGGVTALFNQKTQMVTVWSTQSRSYYTTKLAFPHPKQTPKPKKPKATPSPKPAVSFMNALKSMTEFDVYSETFELTGHQVVNNHAASVFHFLSKTQKHGGKLQTFDGTLALADDLSGIPVQLVMQATGNVNGNAHLDLLSFVTATPDITLFRIPAGYTKAKSILDVVMHK